MSAKREKEDLRLFSFLCYVLFLVLVFASTLNGQEEMRTRLETADRLFAEGSFDEARDAYEKLLTVSPDDCSVIEKLGYIDYFQGRYKKALDRFRHAIRLDPSKRKVMLGYGACACYWIKDCAGAVEMLEQLGSSNHLNAEQLKRFVNDPAYRVRATVEQTIIPFEKLDPLPVLPIEVNGKKILVFLDTGGAQLVLDPKFASENGIEAISQQVVKGFAGGKSAPVSFGKVQSVKLGEIDVENVPVWLLDTRRFSEWFGAEINGILGAELLAQFLPTVDFPRRQLILRIRSEKAVKEVQSINARGRISFIIDGLHCMYAQCSVNQKCPVLMYFDSGLADDDQDVCLVLKGAVLKDLGIPEPERNSPGVGGGGPTQSGYVDIAEISVGGIARKNVKAVYQGHEGTLFSHHGYKTYGLISHNFLKHYSWTIDFDNRYFIFSD